MNEHMNEQITKKNMKDIIKKELFLPGLLALRTILVKPLSKYNGKKPNIPTLPGWIKTDDTDDKYFETWYAELNKMTENFIPSRAYKISQAGNFGISQPTGGFIITTNKQIFKKQYTDAINDPNPRLMVITEPFKSNFLNNENYTTINSCGLLFNTAFNDLYSIESSSTFPPNKYVLITVTAKPTATRKLSGFTIANWHGNSKGTTENDFKTFLDWATKNNVNYITGDSNITPSKTKTTIQEVLNNHCANLAKDYSKHIIVKDRWAHDIILNNQLDKHHLPGEIDGMFIVELINPITQPTEQPILQDIEQPVQSMLTLNAFNINNYNDNTNPILADHAVVKLSIPNLNLTIMAASGASADDPSKGIFPKDEWDGVNINTFHVTYGNRYTLKWVEIYNEFAKNNNFQTIQVPEIIGTSFGGKRSNKYKRRRSTRKRNKKYKSRKTTI